MEDDVNFVMNENYSNEFLEVLGRTMFQSDCDTCEGTGVNLEKAAIVLIPGLGIVMKPPEPCVCCNGLGWHYMLFAN